MRLHSTCEQLHWYIVKLALTTLISSTQRWPWHPCKVTKPERWVAEQRTTKHSLRRRVWRRFLWEFNGPIKKWFVRKSVSMYQHAIPVLSETHTACTAALTQPPGNDVGIGKPSAKHQFPIWHCKQMSRPEVTFASLVPFISYVENSEVRASQWCWCRIHVFLKLHSH